VSVVSIWQVKDMIVSVVSIWQVKDMIVIFATAQVQVYLYLTLYPTRILS